MYTSLKYDIDVGTFFARGDSLNFNEPTLRIPLVNDTIIGRASGEEQDICDGGIKRRIGEHENIACGIMQFIERPSYNGKKIIIPNDPNELNIWISRKHGELKINEGNLDIYYKHLSKSNMLTAIWAPSQGIIEDMESNRQLANLHFSDSKEPETKRYLLLGGKEKTQNLEERFPYYSFYVLIRRKLPQN